MKNHKLATTLTALTASFVTASAVAAPIGVGTEIGVDFGTVAPTNNFNDAATTSGSIAAASVIDTSNVVVDGVGFTWSGGAFANDAAADSTDLPGQPSIFNDSNLTDWLGENGTGTLTLTFTGLDDALTYDLVIGHGFVVTVNNTDTTYTADSQSATNDHGVGASAYVTLSGLSTDGSGNLVITTTGNGSGTAAPELSNFTAVAALQLTAVPEPGSLALLGLGGLMMIKRRRR